jgi:hypothetical protein
MFFCLFFVTLYTQYRNKVLSALTSCICGDGVNYWQIHPQSDLGFITPSFFHTLQKPHELRRVWYFIPGLKRVDICPNAGHSHILYYCTFYVEVLSTVNFIKMTQQNFDRSRWSGSAATSLHKRSHPCKICIAYT